MSIMYCEKHSMRWDSDFKSECPACEDEPSQEAMEAAKAAYQALPDDCLPSAHIECIARYIDEAVAAERARRIKAEEVVDAVIKGTGLWGSVYSLAEDYRAQYPRVEKEQAFEWQCSACGAMLPSSEKHCPCRFEQQEP